MSTTDVRGGNVIDSRDVIARLADLESNRDSAKYEDPPDSTETETADFWTAQDGTKFTSDWDEEQEDEYQALKALDSEASYGDWQHGESLIRDDYFEEYARQLADDLGMLKSDNQWPYTCIDWEQAADELKQDYSCVEFAGFTYWIRA